MKFMQIIYIAYMDICCYFFLFYYLSTTLYIYIWTVGETLIISMKELQYFLKDKLKLGGKVLNILTCNMGHRNVISYLACIYMILRHIFVAWDLRIERYWVTLAWLVLLHLGVIFFSYVVRFLWSQILFHFNVIFFQ